MLQESQHENEKVARFLAACAQVQGVSDVDGDFQGRLLTVHAPKSVRIRALMEAVRTVVRYFEDFAASSLQQGKLQACSLHHSFMHLLHKPLAWHEQQ